MKNLPIKGVPDNYKDNIQTFQYNDFLKLNKIINQNSLAKYSFAKKVAKKFKLNTRLIKPYKSNFIRDKRPLGTYMPVKKFEENTNLKLPSINYCISIL